MTRYESRLTPRSPHRRVLRGYETREALQVRRRNSLMPYLRVHDRLCRHFLTVAADPAEYDGLRHLFPFVREASVLQVPLTRDFAPELLVCAFLAAHDLGRARPELADDILAGPQYHQALRRMGLLRQMSQEERLTPSGLRRAFQYIIQANWPKFTPEALETLVDLLVKTLRLGFMAGSIAPTDPVFCDFVGEIPARTDVCVDELHAGVLVASLRRTRSWYRYEMWHPLLKFACSYYREGGWECAIVCDYLRIELRRLGVRSETQCPNDHATLLRWLADGMAHGQEVLQRQRDVVERIYAEHSPEVLQLMIAKLRSFVTKAGGREPERMLESVRQLYGHTFNTSRAGTFAGALKSVLCAADFGLWIPWAMDNQPCQLHLPLMVRPRQRKIRAPVNPNQVQLQTAAGSQPIAQPPS